jgi:hypothetical protein
MITHEQMISAGEYAVKLHGLDKIPLSERDREYAATLISLGAYRAVEYLNKGQSNPQSADKGEPLAEVSRIERINDNLVGALETILNHHYSGNWPKPYADLIAKAKGAA